MMASPDWEGDMQRRNFITLLGGAAAAWPLAAHAQQPAMPVIGFLSSRSPGESEAVAAAFRRGLAEAGYVAGQNVAIEYRWTDGQYDRLPELAAEFVQRRVAVIVAVGAVQAIRAAKTATSTIPVVFVTGDDPVRLGLVASLNRPGGNVTGSYLVIMGLGTKRLALLNEFVVKGSALAMLVNPTNPATEEQSKDAQAAASTLGHALQMLSASTASEIDGAFEQLARGGASALLVSADPFFNSRRAQIVALSARNNLVTFYHFREFAEAGGLMSYGPSIAEGYRQAGVYAGRILKGEKPGDLPVLLPTKFEFVINIKTAKALGLEIPAPVMALSDDVIE
jgi:putative tryptophan/tyrosine transport system substrate-binding protein